MRTGSTDHSSASRTAASRGAEPWPGGCAALLARRLSRFGRPLAERLSRTRRRGPGRSSGRRRSNGRSRVSIQRRSAAGIPRSRPIGGRAGQMDAPQWRRYRVRDVVSYCSGCPPGRIRRIVTDGRRLGTFPSFGSRRPVVARSRQASRFRAGADESRRRGRESQREVPRPVSHLGTRVRKLHPARRWEARRAFRGDPASARPRLVCRRPRIDGPSSTGGRTTVLSRVGSLESLELQGLEMAGAKLSSARSTKPKRCMRSAERSRVR